MQYFDSELLHFCDSGTRINAYNVIICLRVMLVGKKGASAVKRGFLRHDPSHGVETPTKNPKQVAPPTPEEVWKLVDAGEEIGGPGRDTFFVDALTGLRRNEILALQYSDVDGRNKELAINKAVSKTKVVDGVRKWEWRIGPPKSRKSNLRLAAAEAVLELLRRLRANAEDPAGLVFTDRMENGWIPTISMTSSSAGSRRMPGFRMSGLTTCLTLRVHAHRPGRKQEIRLRSDGPLRYSGHVRHLRAPLSEFTRTSSEEAATGDV